MSYCSISATTYAEELYKLRHGLPQWHPEVAIKTGDVGFFIGGIGGPFFRLFNIHEPADDQPEGVPEGFEPFIVQNKMRVSRDCQLDAQSLHSLSVRRTELGAGLSSCVTLQFGYNSELIPYAETWRLQGSDFASRAKLDRVVSSFCETT